MDPTTDMADRQELDDEAPLLGPAARAFGKAALVAYWLACLAVIAFGLSQMSWSSPPPKATPHAAAAPPRPAPAKATRPAPSPAEWALAPQDLAPPPTPAWISALALLSLGGLVLLWRPWSRRRGSRQFGRFSGRGRRLGSMRQGFGRRWGF